MGNNEQNKTVPLVLMVQTARSVVYNALNALRQDIGLPYYLIDGIFSEVLSEIRQKEIVEFSSKRIEEEEGE